MKRFTLQVKILEKVNKYYRENIPPVKVEILTKWETD